ncbi:amino acid transporter [Cytobacillus depressus]|uniref:Amino acid transporter n=1 Tax=Cytobacillus depressus TaxID=1602942 RepID=A0A6L3V1A0_9BACI|nr:amino acid transporter [Cytobacillus depressus]
MEGAPFNDAMDHLGRIEGYPTKNLSKVNLKSLPLPIRILGYLLIGSMGLGVLTVIILNLIK